MKNLILSCLAASVLVSLVGCSCDKPSSTSTNNSAPLQTDTKDMHPVQK